MTDNKNFDKEALPQVVDTTIINEKTDTPIDTVIEQKNESAVETNVNVEEKSGSTEIKSTVTTQTSTTVTITQPEVKSELRKAVERVMEADLRELYLTMTPAERQVFKKKGEETAREITSLIEKTKLNLNKIIKLLFNWLRLIPKVNSFFIEQEAKLKADQLLKLPK